MIFTGQDPLESLRDVLEEQYEQHSVRLADLAARAARNPRAERRRGSGAGAGQTAPAPASESEAEIAASRRELAEIARALRHMAEGVYGRCEACWEQIPFARLRSRPHTRFCVPCEERSGR